MLAFERDPGFVCVLNCSKRPVRLSSIRPRLGPGNRSDPDSLGRLLIASDPVSTESRSDGVHQLGHLLIASGKERQVRASTLPPDTAAWSHR